MCHGPAVLKYEKMFLSIFSTWKMGKLKWLWWWWAGNGRQLREEGWSVRMINSRCPELPAERKKRILCPAGSGHPGCLYFHLVGKLWSVRMSLFSRRKPKVMNKVSFVRRWIWIFLTLYSFARWSHQTIYIWIYGWWWSIKTWALLGRDPPRNPGS